MPDASEELVERISRASCLCYLTPRGRREDFESDGRDTSALPATGSLPEDHAVRFGFGAVDRPVSLVVTDPLGRRDLAIPDSVRIYQYAGNPHLPSLTSAPAVTCKNLTNPAR